MIVHHKRNIFCVKHREDSQNLAQSHFLRTNAHFKIRFAEETARLSIDDPQPTPLRGKKNVRSSNHKREQDLHDWPQHTIKPSSPRIPRSSLPDASALTDAADVAFEPESNLWRIHACGLSSAVSGHAFVLAVTYMHTSI